MQEYSGSLRAKGSILGTIVDNVEDSGITVKHKSSKCEFFLYIPLESGICVYQNLVFQMPTAHSFLFLFIIVVIQDISC